MPLFRPPDGQRRSDAEGFFKSQGLQVALWDIDAQDGAGKLKGSQSAQRVLTLMLLWRHGVINFNVKQDALKNGDALAHYANGAKRDRLGRLSGRVSLKTAKGRKHWGKGDFFAEKSVQADFRL